LTIAQEWGKSWRKAWKRCVELNSHVRRNCKAIYCWRSVIEFFGGVGGPELGVRA
jgi:hypothetical protein